jgi:hypothetical protein
METQLTADEIYLYALLYMEKNITNEVKTSVSVLSDIAIIKFYSKKDRNNKALSDSLVSLKNKGIIRITNFDGEELDLFKSNESIRISFINYEYKGYTTVKQSTVNKFDNALDFLIFINVAKWHRKGSFDSSYSRWARILSCTTNTAISRINKAVENQIIYRNKGNYINNDENKQKVQDINSYRVIPFEQDKKTIQTLIYEESVANINFRKHIPKDETFDVGKLFNKKEYNEALADTIAIFSTYEDEQGYNIYPNEDDYYIYIQTKASLEFRNPTKQEEKFMQIATTRIKQLENNSEFVDSWSIAELRFIELVNKEEYEKQTKNKIKNMPTNDVTIPEDISLMF